MLNHRPRRWPKSKQTIFPCSMLVGIQEMLEQCWFNSGPPSTKLTHHLTRNGSMFRLCRDGRHINPFNAGTVFRRQNLTSKVGPCTETIYDGHRPITYYYHFIICSLKPSQARKTYYIVYYMGPTYKRFTDKKYHSICIKNGSII